MSIPVHGGSGRSLAEMLGDGPVGARAVDILRSAATELDALHDRGIIHGDLSPAVVLVDGSGTVTLCRPDSGPATGSSAESVTATGGDSAAAVYQPPERAVDSVISHRTDIYSFACIAFEVITGDPPFTLATLLGQASGEVPRAGAHRAGLPDAVNQVFDDALALRPEDRPPSATALVDSLQSAFGSGYRRPAGRRLRRLMWASAAAAAATVVAATLTAVLTAEPSGVDRSPATSTTEPGDPDLAPTGTR